MTRATFSVDHKQPWLDSEDPVGNFFDIDNISYSHLKCNSSDARRPNKKSDADIEAMSPSARKKVLRERGYWQKKAALMLVSRETLE